MMCGVESFLPSYVKLPLGKKITRSRVHQGGNGFKNLGNYSNRWEAIFALTMSSSSPKHVGLLEAAAEQVKPLMRDKDDVDGPTPQATRPSGWSSGRGGRPSDRPLGE